MKFFLCLAPVEPELTQNIPSFRLEHLTAANNIEQIGAHDALVDVKATIDIARLIKEKQPRLYDYFFNLRPSAIAHKYINLRTRRKMGNKLGASRKKQANANRR